MHYFVIQIRQVLLGLYTLGDDFDWNFDENECQ